MQTIFSNIDGIPDSIFVKILRAHLRNVSSTFSPVKALVSRNINSAAKPLQDITYSEFIPGGVFSFPGIREWSFSFPGIPGARE